MLSGGDSLSRMSDLHRDDLAELLDLPEPGRVAVDASIGLLMLSADEADALADLLRECAAFARQDTHGPSGMKAPRS